MGLAAPHRAVVAALDLLDLDAAAFLASRVGRHPDVYGFKVGFSLALPHGLPRTVEALRRHTDKPIVYDHQKAGTDIPDTGALFARTLSQAGVEEAILFPQAGPETLRAWAAALSDHGIRVVVGGVMTHRAYLRSEGGWISDEAAVETYRTAHALGVRRFVVPLTKPALVRELWSASGMGDDCVLYSPGYGAQKGDAAAFAWVPSHLVIVGRSLLAAPDPCAYVDSVMKELGGAE